MDIAMPTAGKVTFRAGDRVHALVDTGADMNMVRRAYAERLGARPVNWSRSFSVHGVKDELDPVYLLAYRVEELGEIKIAEFVGVGMPAHLPVLLGRAFLSGKVMIYDGIAGRVTLAV